MQPLPKSVAGVISKSKGLSKRRRKKKIVKERPLKPLVGSGPISDAYGSDSEAVLKGDASPKGERTAGYDSDGSSGSANGDRRRRRNSNLFRMPHSSSDSSIKSNDNGDGSSDEESQSPHSDRSSCLKMPAVKLNDKAKAAVSQCLGASSPWASSDGDLLPTSLPAETAGLRYSLRSCIGDGAKKQPTGPTIMERRLLRPNGCHVDTSYWTDMGNRHYMEDRVAIEELGQMHLDRFKTEMEEKSTPIEMPLVKNSNEKSASSAVVPMTWFGVFDGHGGPRASQYCCDWLSTYVRHDHYFPSDLGSAMRSAVRTIDQDFVGTGHSDGTTVCACVVVGDERIVCANAGDSRAIVIRGDNSIVRLSRDHKPGVPDETKRITDLGGKVVYWGRWRVEGLLAVSRGVGDAALKPYVCADAEICEYDIGVDDLYLVVASDGVWDVLDNDDVAKFVIDDSRSVSTNGSQTETDLECLRWTARKLCDRARNCGSSDNLCAIVVDLKSSNHPLSIPAEGEK